MASQNQTFQRLREALEEAARYALDEKQEDPCSAVRLCRLERAIVESLLSTRQRQTLPQLRQAVEDRLAEPVSEGMLKMLLARLAAPEVAILDSSRCRRPHGYQLTAAFRALFNPD